MENDRLKFRVWDAGLNLYITNAFDVAVKNNGELVYWNGEPIKNCTVEQCTGFKDKNDKLIFEGDKTRYKDRQDDYIYGYIMWRGSGFSLMNTDGSLNGILWTPNNLEIIGNIHEEPSNGHD